MYVCPEEESVLMSSFVSTLSGLSIKQGDHNKMLSITYAEQNTEYISNNTAWHFALQWKTKRSLISERSDWTGWDYRSAALL